MNNESEGMNTSFRISISIPRVLRDRMRKWDNKVNWSRAAADGIRQLIMRLEAGEGQEKETKTMSEKEWEQFFTLLRKVVNQKDKTANEKLDSVVLNAQRNGGETDLGEFVAWFGGEYDS